MAGISRYFDPNTFLYKVIGICALIIIDIFLSSISQFFTFGSIVEGTSCKEDNYELCIVIAAIQVALQVVIIFIILSIFSNTFFFKHGFCGHLCRNFLLSFICLLVYPIYMVISKGILGQYLNYGVDPDTPLKIWQGGRLILIIFQYITGLLFYLASLKTTFELGRSEYYKDDVEFIEKIL